MIRYCKSTKKTKKNQSTELLCSARVMTSSSRRFLPDRVVPPESQVRLSYLHSPSRPPVLWVMCSIVSEIKRIKRHLQLHELRSVSRCFSLNLVVYINYSHVLRYNDGN